MTIVSTTLRLLSFSAFYVREVVLSNIRVAYDVLTPTLQGKPAMLAVDVSELTPFARLVLANLITMTPGTLSLDLSADCRTLYVHALFVEDLEAEEEALTRGFVHRVRDVFCPPEP